MLVWLNGQFVERDKATVSVFDAGLQHGIGLFETMAAHNGVVFRSQAHARRLVDSAKALLLSERLRADPLAEAVNHALERNGQERARIRLTVTGGNLALPSAREGRQVDPTVIVDVQPPTAYPDEFFENGVLAVIAAGRLNPASPMAGHKTLDYWPRIHALQLATVAKAGEALWFTVTNHLAGGSVSNAFLVSEGVVHTPFARGEDAEDPAGAAVLPGITRAAILELCDEAGLDVQRRALTIHDVLGADEVFLTNSSWGVLPVTAVEKETIGSGAVGPVAASLREALLELVERETTAGAA